MPDPFYGCLPSDGLHILKDKWCQKSHLLVQSQALVDDGQLEVAIAATIESAPCRRQRYCLDRELTSVMDESQQERRLEAALMRRWGVTGMWPVPGAWTHLVACQVPLFGEQKKKSWGYIDLLGVTAEGVPVVVELKKDPSANVDGKTERTETPLRMVLEAAAYAIALRKNWEKFREEWIDHLTMVGISEEVVSQVPSSLTKVPLVAVAPASFWIDWLPVTEKGKTVTPETWKAFQRLLDGFSGKDMPVSFVSISGHDQNVDGLAVQPLVGFPPVS